jgi:glutathione S-transferase
MLYIADVSGSLPTPEARGAAASWVLWANATMWPALEGSGGKCNLDNLFGPVDTILGKQQWLLGDKLSVADVAVASYIKYAQLFFKVRVTAFPNVVRYMADVEKRESFKKTVGGG